MSQPTAPLGIPRGSAELLPWTLTSEELVRPSCSTPSESSSSSPAPLPQLSLIERVSSPTIFIHQALVYRHALDAGRLREALSCALALFPTLACRAAKDAVRAGGGTAGFFCGLALSLSLPLWLGVIKLGFPFGCM